MDNELLDFMTLCQQRAEDALAGRLPPSHILPQRLHEAMRYSALGGGKRMRPMLTYAAGRVLGVPFERLDGPACAVECIHVYSLIHDDLPAMDNDDLRRGKPTCHRAYDEATAILAGDALQALAFQILADDPGLTELPAEQRVQMIRILARASGSQGMAGGQAIDLDAVGKRLTVPELENMHIHKTGALIRASVQLASLACVPAADTVVTDALDRYAKCMGLAFQVQDDILDEESDTATLGKTSGKDRDHDKPTYPALLGMEGAKRKAHELHEEALTSLKLFGAEADVLRALSRYIIERKH